MNSDVITVRCTNIVPIVSCQIRMLTARNKLASAEDNGVVIHNPLALTHTFQPCRPACRPLMDGLLQQYVLTAVR